MTTQPFDVELKGENWGPSVARHSAAGLWWRPGSQTGWQGPLRPQDAPRAPHPAMEKVRLRGATSKKLTSHWAPARRCEDQTKQEKMSHQPQNNEVAMKHAPSDRIGDFELDHWNRL